MTCLSEVDKAANVRRTSSYTDHVGGSACSQDGKREQSQVKHGARQMEADVWRDDDVLARSETSVHCNTRKHKVPTTVSRETGLEHELQRQATETAANRELLWILPSRLLCWKKLSKTVVTCAIIACNALQFLHATIAGFQTRSKIFMRPKCCSQWQCLVESRDVVGYLCWLTCDLIVFTVYR